MQVERKLQSFQFYHEILKSAKYFLAPMVDQSEYAWRVLSRRYGAQVCYTPMINARMFADKNGQRYRDEIWSTGEGDRPLIVQFCANDPESLLNAALRVQDHCDAIDLNLGCPQHIARRGHYGAFLQDEWDLIYNLINTLHKNLSIPVTAKIRIFPDVDKTIRYAKMIESAGAQLLTVHGRIREQKGHKTGLADWEQIRRVKEALNIPVIANGNILYFENIEQCLRTTLVDGVMTAEGNLYNPAIFANINPPIWQMAEEYLEICQRIPTKIAYVRGHLFKIFRPALSIHTDIRDSLAKVNKLEEFIELAKEMKRRLLIDADKHEQEDNVKVDEKGYKTFPHWLCQPYIRTLKEEPSAEEQIRNKHRDEKTVQDDTDEQETLSNAMNIFNELEQDTCGVML